MTTTRADRRKIISNLRNDLKNIAEFFTKSFGLGLTTMDLINDPDDRAFISNVILPLCRSNGKSKRQLMENYTPDNGQRIKQIMREVKNNSEKASATFGNILEDRKKSA